MLRRLRGGPSRGRPVDPDAGYRAALRAVLEEQLDDAEAELAAIARADSNQIDAYLALGQLYRRRGEIGRAIRIHQNLLLRRDLDAAQRDEALRGLARDFRRGGFLQRAIAAYEELVGRIPRDTEGWRALARLHADVRDFPRALVAQQRAQKLEGEGGEPGEAKLWVEMAAAAQHAGRNDDARKALKRALALEPTLAAAWVRLGELEAERGKSKRALAAWKRAVAVDRRVAPEVYTQLEASYAAVGRPREFETLLRGLIAERPADLPLRLALVRTLAARGDVESALAEADEALARDADDLGAHAARAHVLLRAGRDAEAVKALEELLASLERQGLLGAREHLE